MRAFVVVDALVVEDVLGQRGAVVDLVQVEVLVLHRAVEALDHAVGLWRAVTGADVLELWPAGDVARERSGLVARAVVGDDLDRGQLARLAVDEIGDQRRAEDLAGVLAGGLQRAGRLAPGLRRGDRAGQTELGDVVDDADSCQVPPARVSSSVKSVCQTRLRRVGGSWNVCLRARASSRRSAL